MNYKCICGKEFTNSQGFNGHKGRCKIHMESQGKTMISFSPNKFRKIWNPLSDLHKQAISKSLTGNPLNKGVSSTIEAEIDRKKRISSTMKKNPLAGGLREGSGRGEKSWYESPIAGKVYLRSTYELRFVKILDDRKIKWKQNLVGFEYFWKEEIHKYYPDFYLIDEEIFIEVKGFKTLKDEEKWKQFPHKLRTIFLRDIEEMENGSVA